MYIECIVITGTGKNKWSGLLFCAFFVHRGNVLSLKHLQHSSRYHHRTSYSKINGISKWIEARCKSDIPSVLFPPSLGFPTKHFSALGLTPGPIRPCSSWATLRVGMGRAPTQVYLWALFTATISNTARVSDIGCDIVNDTGSKCLNNLLRELDVMHGTSILWHGHI